MVIPKRLDIAIILNEAKLLLRVVMENYSALFRTKGEGIVNQQAKSAVHELNAVTE
jgi:hypothetical protein